MEQWEQTGPVPGHSAFGRNDPAAVHSQAAFLLALAHQRPLDVSDSQSHVSGYSDDQRERGVDPEDAELLDLPNWPHPLFGADLTFTRTRLLERFSGTNADLWPPKLAQGNESGLAGALYDNPSAEAGLNLIHACLFARHPLVRVAAAAADLHLDLVCHDLVAAPVVLLEDSIYALDPLVRVGAARGGATDSPDHFAASAHLPLPRQSIEILMRGAGAQDELVRDVAVSALEGARFHFESSSPQDASPEESTGDDLPAPCRPRTSVLIHGTTFGRTAAGWWKPGRVFPEYLKANVSHNLYSGSKPFYWSGLYSHRARELGADDLVQWANAYALDHVFAYSHGGAVAMLASERGLAMDKLVLLSCPVHSRYAPDFQRVPNVVSVRTRLDLVILADGGGQRFRDPRIAEHVLPIWFRHRPTRQPDVWRRHNIDAML